MEPGEGARVVGEFACDGLALPGTEHQPDVDQRRGGAARFEVVALFDAGRWLVERVIAGIVPGRGQQRMQGG